MAAPLMRGSLNFFMKLYKFIQKAGKKKNFQIMLTITIKNIKKAETNMNA